MGSALHELEYDVSGAPADSRIPDVNPEFNRTLGRKRENIIGKTSQVVYGIYTSQYVELYLLITETGHPEELEAFLTPMNLDFAVSAYSSGTRKICISIY